MTSEELKAIREKAEAATGEPMCRNLYDLGGGRMFVDDAGVRALILDAYDAPNRDFYFSARADVLALVSEIDRMRKALAYYAKREDWEMLPGSDYHQALYAACDGWEVAEQALANEPETTK